jgi:hypothetical protein
MRFISLAAAAFALMLTPVTSARPSATAIQHAGECEVFPAASAVSERAGHSVGDREASIQIDNGKVGVK